MKKVVWLRIYKGQEILKSENGIIKNENSKVSLSYETLEWDLYLKSLKYNPYCRVSVEKVLEFLDGEWKECEITDEIKKEVLIAHKGDNKVILTPEQKEIAELKAQMAELLGRKENKSKNVEDENVNDELEDLKIRYKEQEKKRRS